MLEDWKSNSIFFTSMFVMLTFMPPLIYTYTKSLLDRAFDSTKDPNNIGKSEQLQRIKEYYLITDQIVFVWTIYILFCLSASFLKIRGYAWFQVLPWAWGIYAFIVALVSMLTYFSEVRSKMWNKCKARWWIMLILIYAVIPILFVVYSETQKLAENFDSFSVNMIFISLGFYGLWWIASFLQKPMQALLEINTSK